MLRLGVLALLGPLLVVPTAVAAGPGDPTVRRSDLPTRADVAAVYPHLEGRRRTVTSDPLVTAYVHRCVRIEAVALGEEGRSASYGGAGAGAVRRADSPTTQAVAFRSRRAARAVMDELEAYVDRCEGTSRHRGATGTLRPLDAPRLGDGASVAYRVRLDNGGAVSHVLGVVTRVDDVVLATSVRNTVRPPRRARAERLAVLQVEARGREADLG